VFRHALRNALIRLVTHLCGLASRPYCLAGSVIVETVFAAGIGQLAISHPDKDLPTGAGIILFTRGIYIVRTCLTDISYGYSIRGFRTVRLMR